jgi:hypothetical protein
VIRESVILPEITHSARERIANRAGSINVKPADGIDRWDSGEASEIDKPIITLYFEA